MSRSNILQFVKFGIVGLSNTFVYLAIYYIFLFASGDLYIIGNVVGWLISVLNAFFWSNRYVFKNEDNTKRELLIRLGRSYVTYGATFLLSTLLLLLEVELWGLSSSIAPLINLLITVPLNFIINKYWTFK